MAHHQVAIITPTQKDELVGVTVLVGVGLGGVPTLNLHVLGIEGITIE